MAALNEPELALSGSGNMTLSRHLQIVFQHQSYNLQAVHWSDMWQSNDPSMKCARPP